MNPNLVYFCSEAYLKRNTSVTQNVDVKDVLPLVKTTADMWVRSIVGTYFYNDLLTKYNAESMSADELTLLDYIQSAVAWRAAADAVVELSYQLKNKGVQTQSGDFSASPEYRAIMWVHGHKEQKAVFYEDRLEEFLRDNGGDYPAFLNKLNKDAKAKRCDDTDAFTSGVMFV